MHHGGCCLLSFSTPVSPALLSTSQALSQVWYFSSFLVILFIRGSC